MHRWVVLQVAGCIFLFSGCGGSDGEPGGTGGGPNGCAHPCPATATMEATCWQQDVACSTVTACTPTRVAACPAEGQIVDCASGGCLACPPPKENDTPMQRCASEHCCAELIRCSADDACLPCLIGGGGGSSCSGGTNEKVAAYLNCVAEHCQSTSP